MIRSHFDISTIPIPTTGTNAIKTNRYRHGLRNKHRSTPRVHGFNPFSPLGGRAKKEGKIATQIPPPAYSAFQLLDLRCREPMHFLLLRSCALVSPSHAKLKAFLRNSFLRSTLMRSHVGRRIIDSIVCRRKRHLVETYIYLHLIRVI